MFAAFASISSFDARLKSTSNLLTYSYALGNRQNEEMLKAWFKLADKCRKKNLIRNTLAHGVILTDSNDRDEKHYWVPFLNSSTLMKEALPNLEFHKFTKDIQRFDAKMIRDKERSFEKLHGQLEDFRKDIIKPLSQSFGNQVVQEIE